MTVLLFDLSDTLVNGLHGVEELVAPHLGLPPNTVLSAFYGSEQLRGLSVDTPLYELNLGLISEDQYLQGLLGKTGWSLSVSFLKDALRANFSRRVHGFTDSDLLALSQSYEMLLVSDHAREWAQYVFSQHPFLERYFRYRFMSFEMGVSKRSNDFWNRVLANYGVAAYECWLVDDSPANLDVARSCGIDGIRFTGLDAANALKAVLL